jgi:hypothetical protein
MAAARHNRPFVMVCLSNVESKFSFNILIHFQIYGGSIKKGFSKLLNKDINVSTVCSTGTRFRISQAIKIFLVL